MSLEVVYYPHPTLRHKSRPLKRVDAQLRKWAAEMLELMYASEGVGLAANQVNLPYRLFVANPQGDPAAMESEFVFINPVLRNGRGSEEEDEGCLSIPDVFAPVRRNAKIHIEGFDLSGEPISAKVKGLFARVIQHETDHLDGTLFVDRLSPANEGDVRGVLEEFELDFKSKQEAGEIPSDADIASRIARLERERT